MYNPYMKRTFTIIAWYGQEPDHFPCEICKENRGDVIRHVPYGRATMFNLPICNVCNEKTDEDLVKVMDRLQD